MKSTKTELEEQIKINGFTELDGLTTASGKSIDDMELLSVNE